MQTTKTRMLKRRSNARLIMRYPIGRLSSDLEYASNSGVPNLGTAALAGEVAETEPLLSILPAESTVIKQAEEAVLDALHVSVSDSVIKRKRL